MTINGTTPAELLARQARAADKPAVPTQAMRVGPGTDAVVWKVCDTNQTVEL